MNRFCFPIHAGRVFWGAMLVAAWVCGSVVVAGADDSKADPSTATNAVAQSPAAAKVKVQRKLTGAELYSIHCNRCHPERFPTERTAAQWKTIMLHMQVRANLPGSQARAILQYLQENSGR